MLNFVLVHNLCTTDIQTCRLLTQMSSAPMAFRYVASTDDIQLYQSDSIVLVFTRDKKRIIDRFHNEFQLGWVNLA